MSIHHVTAIAGDPQRNLDFYTGVLGLRLVKLTVNFDDPSSYHLYFGDELGRPGSILTFFPWPDGQRGRQGTGQVGAVSLAVPPASLGYWIERLVQHGIKFDGPARRFDEQVLSFPDPDGLLLELVATPRVERVAPWADGPVPAEHAVRGLHGGTIWEDGDRGTAEVLTGQLGYRLVGEEGNRLRFESSAEGVGTVLDLRRVPGFWSGAVGVGTVHHVAFVRRPTRRSWSSARGSRLPAFRPRRWWTASTSTRCTSVSPAECGSRSRPMARASPPMSRRPSSARSSSCRPCTSPCGTGSRRRCRPCGCRR